MEFKTEFVCSDCGRVHRALIDGYTAESGAIEQLPRLIADYNGKKAFVFADRHTYRAVGKAVCEILKQAEMKYSQYVFENFFVEPDESASDQLMDHFDPTCDILIGVGSGVINDLGKILAHEVKMPYFIVATAPSMDGYASATASVIRKGLKLSLPVVCPNWIIGDLDVLKRAPERMLIAGLGDMLAKYISIAEWRIGHIVTGEYYCETVADMVRRALAVCVNNREGLLKREEAAIRAVFEGLVISGVAMNYAEISRPASGVEHYFSHAWDMRALAFGTPCELHGIQCGIGTRYAAAVYEKLQRITPDPFKACAYVGDFDYERHADLLRAYLGKGAETMIALEERERKYDPFAHALRLEKLCQRWGDILSVIREELPSLAKMDEILNSIHAPKACEDIGIPAEEWALTFSVTKDIRDKYVASRLCFDLGILDEILQ